VDVRRGSVGCCNDGIVCFNLIQSSFEEYNQHENAYFTEQMPLKKAEIAFNAKSMQRQFYFEALLKVNKTPEIQYFLWNSIC
jgi:hypothetical protein